MARGDLLRKLLISQKRGDDEGFKAAALEIIADEQKKNNNQLARDLQRILNDVETPRYEMNVNPNLGKLPKDRERDALLVDVRNPDKLLSDILLKSDTLSAIDEIFAEYRQSELLRTHGLLPKSKLLFCGPPGCGKSLCAEVISRELGLPLLYTRFDAIVSSYLGETAANLRKVFDYASSGRWVILFDEFDAIGKARDDAHEHGEIKRVVNSFLQLLDSYSSPNIVIAATNHEQLLDPAIWRRFDEILFFPLPTIHDIRELLSMKLKNFPHRGFAFKDIAPRLKGYSHADIERVCYDAIRISIIGNMSFISKEVFERALERERERQKVKKAALRKADG